MLVVMLGVAKLGSFWPRGLVSRQCWASWWVESSLASRGSPLISTEYETIHMLSELGVFILLLAIGLETDIGMLLRVGATSAAVAIAGVVLPFGLGYLACRGLGLANLVAVMAGAALTATSVGITARVLADLGRLRDVEGQIILGAAILDDMLGLVILTVGDRTVTWPRSDACWSERSRPGSRFGFLIAVHADRQRSCCPGSLGSRGRSTCPEHRSILALIMAFGLAWLADKAGSAMVLGAFAAGLLLAARLGCTRSRKVSRRSGISSSRSSSWAWGFSESARARSHATGGTIGASGGRRF